MEGDSFQVEASVASLSNLIKVMIEGTAVDGESQEIPLPNMHSNVLAKVIEFCNHFPVEPMNEIPKPVPYGKKVKDYVQPWYARFMESLDTTMLFELILAANYLDVKPLLQITCSTVGLLIMNKTPEEIKEVLGIEKEGLSSEVERQLREDNKWSTQPAATS
ncbi:unnamed protein product [Phaeothamnion confervicola]